VLRQVNRPFAESCEQNREPILAVLRRYLDESVDSLLEIGSGTGQQAVYFAPQFPWLSWQTSDRTENHPGIRAWLQSLPSPNIREPLVLDVVDGEWPRASFGAVFSANTAHIMDPQAVEAMFEGVGSILQPGGVLLLYGPFNIDGRYTAPSNERFDRWLQSQDPRMGIRDLGWLNELARDAGLAPAVVIDMPADNKLLCFKKA
jgi:SAM-dependent methyltransferase